MFGRTWKGRVGITISAGTAILASIVAAALVLIELLHRIF